MIGVYGYGKWGSAIDFVLSKNHKTLISSRSIKQVPHYVSLDKLLELEYIVLAFSAQHIGEFLSSLTITPKHKFLIASKGIDFKEQKFLDEICSTYVTKENLAFLTGPSFAQEVLKELPTTLCVSSCNDELARTFASFLDVPFIKTYTSDDVKGTEIAGAYKNVIAIASGICHTLGLGNNAQASLISRGLVEMSRFGIHFGARAETFLDISAAGDLFLTANSNMSRNYTLGSLLASGYTLENALAKIEQVVEGVETTYAINSIAKKANIYTPIASELLVILQGGDIATSIKNLIGDNNV